MRQAAVVTGASSGIGLEISKTLCKMGYEVYGFGRNFQPEEPIFIQEHFHPIVCDVLETKKLCTHVKEITAGHPVSVLVNNAGVGYYGLHEELNPQKIQEMVRTNLEVPLILTQQLLRELKRNTGYVINISSVTAQQTNPHGSAYGATKAGLSSFSRSLFDEARKYGVRVAAIHPDMAKTNFYRNADFKEGEEAATYLEPEEVAQAVEYILNQRPGMVVSEVTLKPQLHRIARKKSESTGG